MSEKAQRVSKKLQSLRTNLRQFTRRPQVTMRDVVNQFRTNIAMQMYGQVSSGMNPNQQEASQPHPQVLAQQQGGPQPQEQSSSLLGRGRPTILGSLMGGLRQQQAPQQPQMSQEEIEYQKEQQILYQRAQEKALNEQRKLAKLKRRKNFSVDRT